MSNYDENEGWYDKLEDEFFKEENWIEDRTEELMEGGKSYQEAMNLAEKELAKEKAIDNELENNKDKYDALYEKWKAEWSDVLDNFSYEATYDLYRIEEQGQVGAMANHDVTNYIERRLELIAAEKEQLADKLVNDYYDNNLSVEEYEEMKDLAESLDFRDSPDSFKKAVQEAAERLAEEEISQSDWIDGKLEENLSKEAEEALAKVEQKATEVAKSDFAHNRVIEPTESNYQDLKDKLFEAEMFPASNENLLPPYLHRTHLVPALDLYTEQYAKAVEDLYRQQAEQRAGKDSSLGSFVSDSLSNGDSRHSGIDSGFLTGIGKTAEREEIE